MLLLSALALPLRAQEGRPALPGIFDGFDSYGDIYCDDAKARLDNFAYALEHDPGTHGYIVVHVGRKLPGRALPHLLWPKHYLTSARGIDPGRITVVHAEMLNEMRVELLVAPKGASPLNFPGPALAEGFAERVPVEFDEGWADVTYYRGQPGFWSDGECPLRQLSLKDFAQSVRMVLPTTRAYFIIYTERGRSPRRWGRVARYVRREMIKEGIAPARIVTAYGGARDYPSMEMWLVPKGRPLPEPRPTRGKKKQ